MANRYLNQFLFNYEHALTTISGNFVVDSGHSSGIRSLKGSGIKSVIKVAAGVYKVNLEDTFARYIGGFGGMVSSVTGSTAVTAITPGLMYIIRTLGTTTQAQWETAGVPKGVAAAPGLAFLAAATSAGSGTAFTPVASGIESFELIGDPNLSITQLSDPHFFFQTMGPTAAGNTAMIPVAPVDNSVCGFSLLVRNSSVKGKGE